MVLNLSGHTPVNVRLMQRESFDIKGFSLFLWPCIKILHRFFFALPLLLVEVARDSVTERFLLERLL